MSLLGIDVGTTRCIAAAYSEEGVRLAQAAGTYRAAPGRQGTLDLDVQDLWRAVREAVRQVASATASDPVSALAVSSTGEGLAALDGDGRPLGACVMGLTGAAPPGPLSQAQQLYEITGRPPDRRRAATWDATLCWFRDHRPEFLRAWRVVPLGALVGALLGGATAVDPSQAGQALPLDVLRGTWSRDLIDACRLPRRIFPDLLPAGSPIGSLNPRLSTELGLGRGVRLVLGGHELACQCLAVGAIGVGQALCDLGPALRLATPFHAAPLTPLMAQAGLTIEHHVVEGLYLSRWEGVGERALRWFRDALAPLEKREAQRAGVGVYDLLLGEMPEEPTRLLALVGADGGVEALQGILGLDPTTTRGEIVRALLEGVTYPTRRALAGYERAGLPVRSLRVAGGGAASVRWARLVADVTGLEVERPQVYDAAPLGAAMLAGLGSGVYATAEQAVGAAVRVDARFAPDPARLATYERRALQAERAAQALQGLHEELRAAPAQASERVATA